MNELLKAGIEHPGTEYAYIAPYRKQAKDIAWDKVLKPHASLIPEVSFNESELRCDLPTGSGVQLFGGENAHSLRGMHLSGAVLDEFAQMRPNVWKEVVFPALQRKDGRAIFIGTPLGRNHFYELYNYAAVTPGWYAELWPASRSGVFTEEQLAEFKRLQGPDLYAQEYECSFEAAIQGAYYARQIENARTQGRIKPLAYEPALPVETWWDLGWSDSTAIIFTQTVGREIHVLDYLEESGRDLAFYAQAVQRREYTYGSHYLPHDAGYQQLGAGGKTIAQQLTGMGLRPVRVGGKNDVLYGINQARLLFPRVWFDSVKAARLVDALGAYRSEWDEKKATYKPEPLHDWSSHGADAFRYLAIGMRDPGRAPMPTHARTGATDVFGDKRRELAQRAISPTAGWR